MKCEQQPLLKLAVMCFSSLDNRFISNIYLELVALGGTADPAQPGLCLVPVSAAQRGAHRFVLPVQSRIY